MILPVAGHAETVLFIYAEVREQGGGEDEEIDAALDAYDARACRLTVTPENASAVADALVALSNGCDEECEGRNRAKDPETRRAARHARNGLSSLASKCWALITPEK